MGSESGQKWISPTTQATVALRAFGFLKIPLLFLLRPKVLHLDSEVCKIRIPLGWWSKNHLGSMYFGAIAAGMDCAVGLAAVQRIRQKGSRINLVFKTFQVQFHKRAEGDVVFETGQGREIAALVDRAESTGEREELEVKVVATTPKLQMEPVATGSLTLSLKRKS